MNKNFNLIETLATSYEKLMGTFNEKCKLQNVTREEIIKVVELNNKIDDLCDCINEVNGEITEGGNKNNALEEFIKERKKMETVAALYWYITFIGSEKCI